MNSELNQNLQILATRFPDLFEELKTQLYQQPSPEELNQYLDQIYGGAVKDDLLTHWVERANLSKFHVTVMTGFGDASHLIALLNVIPASSRICVIEPDLAKLLAVLATQNLTEILNDPRFFIVTPFCYREIIMGLNVELIAIQSAAKYLYPPIHNLNSALFDTITDTVLRQLTIRWNQLRTDVTNAEVVFSNTIRNLSQHQLGSEITALQGIFKGKSLVLVGAGPSLDESFDFLKEAQGKAIIAVVNSAFRSVRSQGIQPDITVAVDPFEGTFKGYKGTDTSDVILFSTYLVYPEVPKMFPNRVFPLSSYNFLMTILRKILNLPEEPGIVGDGTVSTTVVNLAAYFGCSEIYLVGQDMAVSKTGRIHTKNSFYNEEGQNRMDTNLCQWLPGNTGDLVPVEAKLGAYLKIFENQVSNYSGIQFYNLAREGVKIHGVPYLDSRKASEQLATTEQTDFRATLNTQLERARIPTAAYDALKLFFQKYTQFLDQLIQALMNYAVEAESNPEIHEIELNSRNPKTETLSKKREQILSLFRANGLFTTLVSEGRTKREIKDFITEEESWKIITDDRATIGESLPYVWAMIEGSVFQLEHFQEHFDVRKTE